MTNYILLLPVLIPLFAGISILLVSDRMRPVREMAALCATSVNLIIAFALFKGIRSYSAPWAGFGFEFVLRSYHFSNFILLAAAGFAFLVTLYSSAFMSGRKSSHQFYVYLLISLAFVNGAVLADNILLLLFFWEGLLLTLFGMIAIGRREAFKTATKAFVIVGISDLCMMIGMALAAHLAGTFSLSNMHIPLTGLGGLAFILLMIGAIAKAGSMPFHSWIPDAAVDAPLPFMAILPASLEKLLGIYFLTRISLDMFELRPDTWISIMLMVIGAGTILFAVMMALVQKDFKRLLSYHAISQVGYMILGIGTLVPAGIIGGLFHMINNALYKSCLFLTGGSVERQAGTTDLEKLGGLARKMPITFISFVVAALSISGVPPFNGFFSKELIYDGALERGSIFYIAALIGSFFTAASFLKLGHAAFLGKRHSEHSGVKEAPVSMLIPMVIIASFCLLFGLWNGLPLRSLIQPVLGEARLEGRSFAGFPSNGLLITMTVLVLLGAIANHLYGVKRTASGLKAIDHIHYAPGLSRIYDMAEKRYFDPYDAGMRLVMFVASLSWRCDRFIDWLYNEVTVKAALAVAIRLRRLHTGSYALYITWSLVATAAVLFYLMH